jgi:hypothetical protein
MHPVYVAQSQIEGKKAGENVKKVSRKYKKQPFATREWLFWACLE